ncbi:MAG TPA: hypothetical protein VK012_01770, partial [Gemmatimonadales bacterium]|nr:hypothetical protein [Gemmatimonadales bacterium]
MHTPRFFHPWHDIPTGLAVPDSLTAVIEIPANGRNKYELDKELASSGWTGCSTAPSTTPATTA